ncbi:RNA polymerase sigma factor [Cucumibacter marinus]|uniref:RNA polymerase sigma factor n=1 Tax=Cucumibacter marinus TaxID=1121252 RepID=UPI00040D13A4|nr:sigma-70 family RNA polymerase sigma factor [Cucumibacter marinus]
MNTGGSAAIAARLRAVRPRALAALTRMLRDLDLAEDALQDASLAALDTWSRNGIPRDPLAWVLTVARNRARDALRRRQRVDDTPAEELLEAGLGASDRDIEAEEVQALDEAVYKDDVLRLMFMCCHTELSPTDQLALALKVIAGLRVEEIARAFLVSPRAMEQRITRAKKRAGAVAAKLDAPSLAERAARLDAVAAMIYLMFNEGYQTRGGEAPIRVDLCAEAIRLGRLLVSLFPGQPEALGLLALMLLQHSRRSGRTDGEGQLVPLDRQVRSCWDRPMIDEGTVLVEKALRHRQPGPYQVQAAIAAVHCAAHRAEDTDWAEIERLYAALMQIQPSAVVALNHAVAVWKLEGAEAALERLAAIEDELGDYLHFQSTRAALLAEAGRMPEAVAAYRRALGLGPNKAEEAHILQRLAEIGEKN